MKPDEYTEDKPKKQFEWGYLYKVYLVILIAVFLLALANQANAGVFLEIGSNMEYVDSQLPVSDIINDSDTWDAVSNYMNDVHGVPFPSYSDATAMDDLLENVLMFYVGQYCNLSGTAATAVYDACMDVSDAAYTVWDFLTFDLESGNFVVNPTNSGDLSDVIHGVVDPLIYTTPSSEPGELVVGNWFAMPVHWVSATLSGWTRDYVDGTGYVVYMCRVGGDGIIVASFQQGAYASWTGAGGYGNLTCDYTYQGSVSLGYYRSEYGYMYNSSSLNGSYSYYSSESDALADLFGLSEDDLGGDPYLNGEGYIINENPTYAPLSGFSALNYPYRTKIVENHTDTTDPDDPVTYPVGVNTVESSPVYKDVPTWLVDPTVDIPEEPDYLENVDVELPEIEPDTGFITDCYNALPSGIVSMIAVGLGLGVVMKIIS